MLQTIFSASVPARSINLGHSAARVQAILVLSGVYFLAAKLGLSLATVHTSATAVWPPSGIALVAVLRMGPWVWPGVFLGAFLANITTAGNVATCAGIAVGNTLEALAGAWLMHRYTRGIRAFDRLRHIVLYVVLVAFISPAISASMGVISLVAGDLVRPSAAVPVWFTWWLGDAISLLTIPPAIIAWGARPTFQATPGRLAEILGLTAGVFLTGKIVFGGWAPAIMQPYLFPSFSIPVVLWAAFRFEQRGATAATLLMAMLALDGTLNGAGQFAHIGDPHVQLLVLQAFIGLASVTGIVVSAVVAQLTQSLLEKEILLREIHHRVKNNLQVISSLLSLQHDAQSDSTAADLLQESQSRIKTMALIHESLYGSTDLTRVDAKAYLRRLVDYLWSAYGRPGRMIERELSADEVALSVDAAVPCGLIVNELVSNALRHAFPDGRPGRIQVSLRQHGAGDGRIALEVKDNGIGTPPSVTRGEAGGLGLRLVRALAEQLGGQLSIDAGHGTTFTLTFSDNRKKPPASAVSYAKQLAAAKTR